MNRKAILTASIFAALIAVAAFAHGAPGATYKIHTANGDVDVVCTSDNTVAAVELNSNNPATFSWDPLCTSIESGFAITWHVPPPAIRAHDPMSEAEVPMGQCFRANTPPPVGIGKPISPTASYTVQFKYESGLVSARTQLTPTTWSSWRACPGAIDLGQTTIAEAVIPYQCQIHPNMQGLIVVEAAGSIG